MLIPFTGARRRALKRRLVAARPCPLQATDWPHDPAGLIRPFRSGFTLGWMDLGQVLTAPEGRHHFVRAVTWGGRLIWLVRRSHAARYRPSSFTDPLETIVVAEAAWDASLRAAGLARPLSASGSAAGDRTATGGRPQPATRPVPLRMFPSGGTDGASTAGSPDSDRHERDQPSGAAPTRSGARA